MVEINVKKFEIQGLDYLKEKSGQKGDKSSVTRGHS